MQSALFLGREGVDIIYWTGPLGSKFQGWSEPSELLILCQCTRSGLFVDHLTTIGASICSPFLNEKRSSYFLNEDTAFAEVQQTADICKSCKSYIYKIVSFNL